MMSPEKSLENYNIYNKDAQLVAEKFARLVRSREIDWPLGMNF